MTPPNRPLFWIQQTRFVPVTDRQKLTGANSSGLSL